MHAVPVNNYSFLVLNEPVSHIIFPDNFIITVSVVHSRDAERERAKVVKESFWDNLRHVVSYP